MLFNRDERLLDCITNLQEEVKSANESITWWTNRFNALQKETNNLKTSLDESQEVIADYKRENDKLTQELNICMIERNNYLSRIDKAIEIIKKYNIYFDDSGREQEYIPKELLNILERDDK